MDESLIEDDDKFIENLTNVDEFDVSKYHNFDKMGLKQSINRLFQFIEIESNISLDKLDGTYQNLKSRIQTLVSEDERKSIQSKELSTTDQTEEESDDSKKGKKNLLSVKRAGKA